MGHVILFKRIVLLKYGIKFILILVVWFKQCKCGHWFNDYFHLKKKVTAQITFCMSMVKL